MMARETWLRKVKKTISNTFDAAVRSTATTPNTNIIKKSNVGVLAFEVAGLISKLLHLWLSLSQKNITRLHNESISLQGLRKIVSDDDDFLLGLACAEMLENLRILSKSLSRLTKKCEDSNLRSFDRLFDEFADTGRDPNNWVLNSKEMEAKFKKMDEYLTITITLHREIDELTILENGLRKSMQAKVKEEKIMELQQKIMWQKQEVKYLKENSLWCKTFDSVTSLLVRSIFTILARTKLVFGINHLYPSTLPRSLSATAVYPTTENTAGPLTTSSKLDQNRFFELNSKVLKPPSSTLGAAALALHYANLIIVMEKMIRSPQLIGVDARDDLYSMLPNSIRTSLRGRLKGVGFSATDQILAVEWREALQKIMHWLSPLAHNMIKWQNERSFEQQKLIPKTNVVLLQTLYFANQDKTEAAITELLVGLNYIWRFESMIICNTF